MWTLQVLQEIGATDIPMLTIWNKVDLVPNRELVSMFLQLICLIRCYSWQGSGSQNAGLAVVMCLEDH